MPVIKAAMHLWPQLSSRRACSASSSVHCDPTRRTNAARCLRPPVPNGSCHRPSYRQTQCEPGCPRSSKFAMTNRVFGGISSAATTAIVPSSFTPARRNASALVVLSCPTARRAAARFLRYAASTSYSVTRMRRWPEPTACSPEPRSRTPVVPSPPTRLRPDPTARSPEPW